MFSDTYWFKVRDTLTKRPYFMVGYVLGGAFKNSILFERLFFFNIDQTFLLKMGGSLTCGSAKKYRGRGEHTVAAPCTVQKKCLRLEAKKPYDFDWKQKRSAIYLKKNSQLPQHRKKPLKFNRSYGFLVNYLMLFQLTEL